MAVLLDVPLRTAAEGTLLQLAAKAGHEETTAAIQKAIHLATDSPDDPEALCELGEGWMAEEALAISLCCALSHEQGSFRSAVELAVNHDGDRDSTASMVGPLLEAAMGCGAIPESWLVSLERKEVIAETANDLASSGAVTLVDDEALERYCLKYPGA